MIRYSQLVHVCFCFSGVYSGPLPQVWEQWDRVRGHMTLLGSLVVLLWLEARGGQEVRCTGIPWRACLRPWRGSGIDERLSGSGSVLLSFRFSW